MNTELFNAVNRNAESLEMSIELSKREHARKIMRRQQDKEDMKQGLFLIGFTIFASLLMSVIEAL